MSLRSCMFGCPSTRLGQVVMRGVPLAVSCPVTARKQPKSVRCRHALKVHALGGMPPGVDPEKLKKLQEEAMKDPQVGWRFVLMMDVKQKLNLAGCGFRWLRN